MNDGDGGHPEDEQGKTGDNGSGAALQAVLEPRDRAFTCVACGFSTIAEAQPLRYEVQSVCANCGDWTTQLADQDEVIEAAADIAAELDGPTLTERQALAYLLRDLVGMERQPTADVMDSTPSNVDNLQRKAAEKVEDAERVLDALDAIQESAAEEPTA